MIGFELGQDVLGTLVDACWDSGQPRDVYAIALVSAAAQMR